MYYSKVPYMTTLGKILILYDHQNIFFQYQLRNIYSFIFTYDDKSCSPYKYGMAVNGRTASHLYFSFQIAIVVSKAALN